LDFLRVLPEEVTEGRKINLSVRSADTPLTLANFPIDSVQTISV
jgi:hypothetical protein